MEDPSSQNLLLQFVLLFILTVLNAFFSATEMAMVSLIFRLFRQHVEAKMVVAQQILFQFLLYLFRFRFLLH